MKKITGLVFVVVLILALVVTGCAGQKQTGEKPEQAVTSALTALKALDFEVTQKYFTYEDLMGEETDELTGSEEGTELIFNRLAFSIKSSSINGDNATVTTEISNIDMLNVFGEYIQQVFVLAFSNAFSEDPLSEEELEAHFEQLFIELLDDESNMVTTTVDIQLTKSGSSWTITMDESLQDAILGGLVTALNALEDLE